MSSYNMVPRLSNDPSISKKKDYTFVFQVENEPLHQPRPLCFLILIMLDLLSNLLRWPMPCAWLWATMNHLTTLWCAGHWRLHVNTKSAYMKVHWLGAPSSSTQQSPTPCNDIPGDASVPTLESNQTLSHKLICTRSSTTTITVHKRQIIFNKWSSIDQWGEAALVWESIELAG